MNPQWFSTDAVAPLSYASLWLLMGEKGPSSSSLAFVDGIGCLCFGAEVRVGLGILAIGFSSWRFVQEVGVISNNLPYCVFR